MGVVCFPQASVVANSEPPSTYPGLADPSSEGLWDSYAFTGPSSLGVIFGPLARRARIYELLLKVDDSPFPSSYARTCWSTG